VCCWRRPIPVTSCWIRSPAPARPRRPPNALGRNYIGIERDETYARLSRARLKAIEPINGEDLETEKSKKSLPRVPFGALLESGWLKPGDRLFSPQRRYQARIRVDGSLTTGNHSGSIHRLGAHVQQAPACNGWTYWHYETESATWRRSTCCAGGTGKRWA
jgi:modification methylase